MEMDRDREKQELEKKLARCCKLASEFTEGITAANLRQLALELEQRIRALE
jgi:hypothetical protein